MEKQATSNGLLNGFRVLDLTDDTGWLCGKVLGDLGADVIKIEPPGGDRARASGPFYQDAIDPEKSLHWFAFNANKRGITLSIETHRGKELFNQLVSGADCVIESFQPGYLDGLGLGYSSLRCLNPRIIVTSITPFGQSGPYRDYQGSDLAVMAMGGYTALCGEPGQRPVRISFPQACLMASVEAGAGTIIARYARGTIGCGQHVDVSMQESVLWYTFLAPQLWELDKVIPQRGGPCQQVSSRAFRRMYWRCRDGFVVFGILGGGFGSRYVAPLVKWMDEDGMAPDHLKAINWSTLDISKLSTEDLRRIEEPIARFFMQHSKEELVRGSMKRRLLLCALSTCQDVVEDSDLRDRRFWQEVPHNELGRNISYPGGFATLSGAACKISRRAPTIGEHNADIYAEIGLGSEDLSNLRQAGVV